MTSQNDPPVKPPSLPQECFDELRMDEYRDPNPIPETEEMSWEQETEFLEWFLKHTTALDAEEALVTQQYQEIMHGIGVSRKNMMDSHGEEFERISMNRIRKQNGASHIKLLHGTVFTRSYKPSLRVTDNSQALNWALEFKPEIVKHSINYSAYSAVAKEMRDSTGELLPGITITEPKTVLYYPGKPKGEINGTG